MTGMARRKLPIGIQSLRKVREADCYYVDKTPYIRRLLDEGDCYFLSRPRRFGKSLFLDTLKELFEGNEALFEGLAIHGQWDWSVRHPVVRLSFGSGDFTQTGQVEASFMEQIASVKVVELSPPGSAMRAKGYADRYRSTGQPIHLIAVEFSRQTRNLTGFEVADVR